MRHITEVLTPENKIRFLKGLNYELPVGINPRNYSFSAISKIPPDVAEDTMHSTNSCGDLVVTTYIDARHIIVCFLDTGFVTTTQAINIRKGQVKDPYVPSVYGIGYIGEGDYPVSIKRKLTGAYCSWHRMMERCYCEEWHKVKPTYSNCTVCGKWHNFQVFAKWYTENCIEGYVLDKDIKIKGNKVYSPDTCIFTTSKANSIEANAKFYILNNPEGNNVTIFNMSAFCRKNQLNVGKMLRVNTNANLNYKGWTKCII